MNESVHSTHVDVRWSDFDRFGHINNVAYIELAQEARNIFAVEEFVGRGLPVPAVFVKHMEVDYLRPILPDTTQVLVTTAVTRIGTTSFTTRQSIFDRNGNECAIVTCVQVAVDVATSMPRPITSNEAKVLSLGAGTTPDGEADAGQDS
ncbi:thioesterase [Corynebacterium sp. 13CS0277]|uniref:acyl-CoA thioesterase n=1 Tax=Corynebacterium sp. 13CS0277 TaxID=2071994 RepID=UPI000D038FA4|nr:acyl-CoA thioesterase [Corynebacterium sp. 13CS0277]PRQ11775.1 thioesterase [Corynebacterium sp. 13CS0277]